MHQALPSPFVRAASALTDAVDATLLVSFSPHDIPVADAVSIPIANTKIVETTGARSAALDMDPVSPRWS
jgi:hypothetical protein